ncbi:MAG: hypothetical protein OXD39_06850 [Gemmatimonadetes bacterium]|nr:hypothetical protein [Gemmatimonadota bacterium]
MRVCPKPVCVVSAERRSNCDIAIVHHDADGVNRVVEISILDHVRPVQRLALGTDQSLFPLLALRTDRSLFPLLALRTGFTAFALLALDTCFTAFALGTGFTAFSLGTGFTAFALGSRYSGFALDTRIALGPSDPLGTRNT